MEITLEQVQRLREHADVPFGAAKKALEFSGGNLLDALIYLEETGHIPRPDGGNLSTRGQTAPPPDDHVSPPQTEPEEEKRGRPSPRRGLKRLWRVLVNNELEVWQGERFCTSMPMWIFLILVIPAFYIVLPLMLVGLFFGLRYRLAGPDLEREELNRMLQTMADSAADVGRQVMDEMRVCRQRTKTKSAPEDNPAGQDTQSEQM